MTGTEENPYNPIDAEKPSAGKNGYAWLVVIVSYVWPFAATLMSAWPHFPTAGFLIERLAEYFAINFWANLLSIPWLLAFGILSLRFAICLFASVIGTLVILIIAVYAGARHGIVPFD